MKKITSAILSLLLAASMTACGEKAVDTMEEVTAQTTAAETEKATEAVTTEDKQEETEAETATEAETTTETEPVEEPVPEKAELLNSVWTQLNSAESFRMNCNVKGKVPSETSAGYSVKSNPMRSKRLREWRICGGSRGNREGI